MSDFRVTARPSASAAALPAGPAAQSGASAVRQVLIGGGVGAAVGVVASAAMALLAYGNGAHHFADLVAYVVLVHTAIFTVPGGAALGALVGGIRASRS